MIHNFISLVKTSPVYYDGVFNEGVFNEGVFNEGVFNEGVSMGGNWIDKVQDKNIIFGYDTDNTESKDSNIYCKHIEKQLNTSLITAYMQTFRCSKRVAKIKLKRNNMI